MRFTISEVLAEAWHLYTRHAGKLIAVGAIVFGVLSLVQALVDTSGQRALVAVSVGVTIVGVYWLQGTLVAIVEDIRDGKPDLSIGQAFRRVEPRLWALIVSGLLAAIGIVAGLFLLIVPGLVLIAFWSLLTPAIVLEGKGVLGAFSRSQELVSGNFWRVLAVVALTVIGSGIVGLVIVGILAPLPDFIDVYVAGVIANAITIPYVALAWTVMYYELRAFKSGGV